MKTVLDILEELEAESGKLAKQAILEANNDNDLLKRVLKASLDPYVDYGVRKFNKPETVDEHNDDSILEKFLHMLCTLAVREVSGNSAREVVSLHFSNMSARQQKWCERILLKNLRCGVDTTVNKVWPGLIPEFNVALAKSLKTEHVKNEGIKILDKVKYPVRVEPKLDGLRCIAVKKDGVVTMYTRTGNVLESLPTIQAALKKAIYDNYVLDGEAMADNWNDSASVIMDKKNKKDDSKVIYNAFDCISIEEWADQESDTKYSKRLDNLMGVVKTVSDPHVVQVPGITVDNESELMQFYSDTMVKGYEGIMLKDNSPYSFKRSNSLLKMKPVQTFEGTIVGHYEGRIGTKLEGKFGGFEVLLPNGVITKAGGGFSDDLRAEILANGPFTYIGNIVEVEGQPDPLTSDGLTKDGRVHFPVFIRFRDPNDVDKSVLEAYKKYTEAKS